MTTQQNHTSNDPLLLDSLLKVLKESHSFCLSGHKSPDADVVGSQLAMMSFLHRLDSNKKVHIKNCGLPPKNLSSLKNFQLVENVEKVQGSYDVVIVFECSGADRMGDIVDFKTQAKHVINIDHHLHNPYYGTLNFVEPTTSSTAELIFKIIDHSKMGITSDEALCLFTGLVADTGWFRYGNTTPQSFEIAAKLLQTGIHISDLSEKIYMSQSEPSLRLLGCVLTQMKFYFSDKLAVLIVTEDMMNQFHAGSGDMEELVNQGLKRESALVSILLKEKKDENLIKVSLRSKGNVDINQVARFFGGGGHKNASGCAIPGDIANAQEKLLTQLQPILG